MTHPALDSFTLILIITEGEFIVFSFIGDQFSDSANSDPQTWHLDYADCQFSQHFLQPLMCPNEALLVNTNIMITVRVLSRRDLEEGYVPDRPTTRQVCSREVRTRPSPTQRDATCTRDPDARDAASGIV